MPPGADIAYRILALAAAVLLLAVVGAVALLVGARLTAARLAAGARRREAALAPLVHRALEDRAAAGDLRRAVRSRGDRRAARHLLLDLGLDLRGEDARALHVLYRDLGLLAADLRRARRGPAHRRARALADLGALRSAEALPAVVRAVSARQLEVRLAAVHALGNIGGPAAQGVLLGLLGDPVAAVSRRAAAILAEQGREASAGIVAYLRDTASGPGRRAALDLAACLRLAGAVEILLALGADPDPEVRIRAVKAAAAIGDPRCLDLFTRALEDPRWEVRAQAARGLGLLGVPGTVPALEGALGDDQWWVRYRAAQALAESGPGGTSALARAAGAAPARQRDMARYVLARSAALET